MMLWMLSNVGSRAKCRDGEIIAERVPHFLNGWIIC